MPRKLLRREDQHEPLARAESCTAIRPRSENGRGYFLSSQPLHPLDSESSLAISRVYSRFYC
jgi:hypothetical protein